MIRGCTTWRRLKARSLRVSAAERSAASAMSSTMERAKGWSRSSSASWSA